MAQGTGGDFHAIGVVNLRVARSLGTPRAQRLQVFQLQAETTQVQLDVLGQGRVTSGEDEAVATQPLHIAGIVAHHALVKGVCQRCEAHGGAWVTRTTLLHCISCKNSGEIHRAGIGL